MRNLIMIAIGLLVVLTGGCARLMRGESQSIKFVTEPPGATVSVGGSELTTPAEVKLKRKDKHEVTVSKTGYRTVKFELVAQWDGASLGNAILPGGSVGFATDTVTGADRSFRKLSTIKLQAVTDANTPPLTLIYYRGDLYTEAEYQQVLEQERKWRESYFEK